MIKYLLIWILFFTCDFIYSQDVSKTYVGVFYQPGVSNRYNTEYNNGLTWENKYSYSSGVDINCRLINKFWISSGISLYFRSVI
jgi:hypothetical protein